MIFQEYTFDALGAIIEDHGEGKIKLIYGRAADTLAQVAEEAGWIGDIMEALHHKYAKKHLTLLVDLGKLERVSLDDHARTLYKEMMQREYVKKVAIVGDAFSYTKILTIMVMLSGQQDHVRFFFHHTEAKDWLGW